MKKNRSKKLLVAVLAIVTVFSVCTTAFAADIGRFDTSIAALKNWTASVWRSRTSTTGAAVFNTESYNDSVAGFVTNESGATRAVYWGIQYRKNSGGTINEAMASMRRVEGRHRDTASLNTTNTSYQYRLKMHNPYHSEMIKVKGSYHPG